MLTPQSRLRHFRAAKTLVQRKPPVAPNHNQTRYLQAVQNEMEKKLNEIFELENAEKYNEAYSEYQKLISENNADFETWKFYFFFLWSMLEDVNGLFTEDIDLRTELESELKSGLKNYSDLAEFNFIAGYAVSIFPYEFGDYEELDKKGREMLKKAFDLEPNNPIYKMVYLGSQEPSEKNQTEYQNACLESELKVREIYNGNGLLNDYFKQVLIRTEKASR
ncbi:MAG: hypothetical protein D8M59_17115 [Planctomycetes bacterium]|nr:hypothetical protein [Planctomycetota bacterium]